MSKCECLNVWSQFPIGAVVRIRKETGGSSAGMIGVVVERLDDGIDGYARYGVSVEFDAGGRTAIVDVSRCNMSRVHTGAGPRKRALRRRVVRGVDK